MQRRRSGERCRLRRGRRAGQIVRVKLTSLGHAFWLLEAGGLRIAMDPVLGARHTAGIFEIVPRRTIDARSLRPDFILVSHVHLDHFDVPSLAALAELDPETVVVTPDPLVAEVSSIVGFQTVKIVPPATRIDLLDGLSLSLTPSRAPDVEWGVVAQDRTGTAWNMIDTLLEDADEVRHTRDRVCGGRRVDVALAPLQPMREIALATADMVGFVPAHMRHLLSAAAAVEAGCVVPSAAGDAHAAPFEAMNAWVYPVSAERAARDLTAFAPGTRVEMPAIGDSLVIEGGDVSVAPSASGVVIEHGAQGEPRVFRPIDPAPLFDPNLDGRDVSAMREAIAHWAMTDLPEAIDRAAQRGPLAGRELVLEVILPGDRLAFSLRAGRSPREGFYPEYDVLNAVAGSMLLDVIEGRRAWYEALLAGALRCAVRGCDVGPGRADRLPVGPMFVYEAIPYRESTERAVRARARAMARSYRGRRAAELF